jgi:hypothetical protein
VLTSGPAIHRNMYREERSGTVRLWVAGTRYIYLKSVVRLVARQLWMLCTIPLARNPASAWAK